MTVEPYGGDYQPVPRELPSERVVVSAPVQPYITAMLTTYSPAETSCVQAGIATGSRAAASGVYDTNQDCLSQANSAIPDTIRSMLNLPSL
jgi:hypothetical protein